METLKFCIFCSSTENKFSGEHVFPDWVNKHIPKSQKYKNELISSNSKKTWDSQAVNRTIKDVCIGCNTGWMAKLESLVDPLLGPMAFSNHIDRTSLTDSQQNLLALWAQKTVLVMEHTSPKSLTIDRKHYEEVYKTRKPVGSIFVGIAFRIGDEKGLHPVLSYNKYDTPRDMRNNEAWCVCLVVGRVAFLLVGNNSGNEGGVTVSDGRILSGIQPTTDNLVWPSEWPTEAIGGYDNLKNLVTLRLTT